MSLPKPPKDLWSQMDELRKAAGVVEPPESAFTLADYCQRYGVTRTIGRSQLRRLQSLGKIKEFGVYNRNLYFEAK